MGDELRFVLITSSAIVSNEKAADQAEQTDIEGLSVLVEANTDKNVCVVGTSALTLALTISIQNYVALCGKH